MARRHRLPDEREYSSATAEAKFPVGPVFASRSPSTRLSFESPVGQAVSDFQCGSTSSDGQKNVKGITLTELGYDLRKPGATIADPRGSHCGAGAPRFNAVLDNIDVNGTLVGRHGSGGDRDDDDDDGDDDD